MERYDIEKQYEEDEIDLTELLKTIIKERKIVIVITILCTIIASGFAFYKNNQPKIYSAEIILKNNFLNMVLLEKDKTFTFDELEINIERLEGFISNKEINDYLLLNNILNLKK